MDHADSSLERSVELLHHSVAGADAVPGKDCGVNTLSASTLMVQGKGKLPPSLHPHPQTQNKTLVVYTENWTHPRKINFDAGMPHFRHSCCTAGQSNAAPVENGSYLDLYTTVAVIPISVIDRVLLTANTKRFRPNRCMRRTGFHCKS
jgi:hypothetical protein